jgi:NADH-quinone oxidoreductase subunit G
LNPFEASLLCAKVGEPTKVMLESSLFELEVVLRADLPRGVAGLPAGLPPLDGVILPAFCKFVPAGAELSARGAL